MFVTVTNKKIAAKRFLRKRNKTERQQHTFSQMEPITDDPSRKRVAEWDHSDDRNDTSITEESAFSKRGRWQDDDEEFKNDANNDDDADDNNETHPNSHANLASSSSIMATSVAEMIAVPLDLIFHVPPARYGATTAASTSTNDNHDVYPTPSSKPLLSRAEAHCFVSITLLAHELDSLVAVSAQAILEQRRTYASMRQTLLLHANNESNSSRNPQLLALLPLLYVLGERLPRQRLEKIQSELDTVVGQLQMASLTLRQMSEQNWTLAESLLEAHDAALAVNAAAAGTGSSTSIGEQLAWQKQKLSDIQEEVCRRIDRIISLQVKKRERRQNPQRDDDDADAMEVDAAGGGEDQDDDDDEEDFVRIADYCEQIMNRSDYPSHPSLSGSQSQSQSQGLAEMAQGSLSLQKEQALSSHHDLEEQTRQRLHFELSQPSEKGRDEPSWRPTPTTHQTQFSLSYQQQEQQQQDTPGSRQESPAHDRSAQTTAHHSIEGEGGGTNSQTQSPFRTHAVADILTTLASASSHSRQQQHHSEQQQPGR